MKVYAVFFSSTLNLNDVEMEQIQLGGIYTTEEGAKNKVRKIKEMGLDGYYISQSLKGDLLELIRKSEENRLKNQGFLRQNLMLQKERITTDLLDSDDKLRVDDEIFINFKVAKQEEKI